MSNCIDVEFSSNLVETASLLSSVVKFCQEAGMKWIDSSKGCKPTSAHILTDDKVLEAKFPLLGVKGDADDYEIATGLTNRAMTVHLSMISKECHFVGARKTHKLGRDALEALARTYVGMLKCDRLEIGDDQAHLLTFLKFPAYYVKENGEVMFDTVQQLKVDRYRNDTDNVLLQEIMTSMMSSGLTPWVKKEAVTLMAIKFEIPVEDAWINELQENAQHFEEEVHQQFMQRGNIRRISASTGMDGAEDFVLMHGEDDVSGGEASTSSTARSVELPKAQAKNKVKKQYTPAR
jgi:hypothetical protein